MQIEVKKWKEKYNKDLLLDGILYEEYIENIGSNNRIQSDMSRFDTTRLTEITMNDDKTSTPAKKKKLEN